MNPYDKDNYLIEYLGMEETWKSGRLLFWLTSPRRCFYMSSLHHAIKSLVAFRARQAANGRD